MNRSLSITITLVTLALVFGLASPAAAHRPEEGTPDGITRIPDPDTSFAYYQEILSPRQVDIYAFDGRQGQFFHAGINIPQLAGLEDYGVALALIGPGLPAIGEDDHGDHDHNHDHEARENKAGDLMAQLPPLAEQAGLSPSSLTGVVAPSMVSDPFYEPFTQTNYWGRQSIDLNLPEEGQYYLMIWNPDGEMGKYVLDTGTQEVFSPADLLRFPVWWLETRLYFEQGPQLAGISLALFSGLVGLVAYRRRTA